MIVSKRRTMLPHDAMTKRLPNCLLTELKTGETAPGKFTPVFFQSPSSPPDQTDCPLFSEDGHFSGRTSAGLSAELV